MTGGVLESGLPRLSQKVSIVLAVVWNAITLLALSIGGPALGSGAIMLFALAVCCVFSPIGLPLILSLISHIGTVGSLSAVTLHGIKWLISALFLTVASLRFATGADRWGVRFNEIDKAFLVFLLWGLICTTIAARPSDSLMELIRISLFLLVYFVTRLTVTSATHLTILFTAIWLAVLSSSLYSFALLLGQGLHRITGFLGNANAYGLFLTFALPALAVGVVVHKKATFRLMLITGLLIGTVALLLTWSRTAILAVVVQAITYLILEKHKRILACLAILAVAALMLAATSPSVNNAFSILMRLKTGATHRPLLWNAGVEAVADNPVFGLGFAAQKQDVVAKVMWGDFASYELFSGMDTPFMPHNAYIYIALTTGLPGLFAYLWLYRAAWVENYRRYRGSPRGRERRMHAIMLSLLIGTLAHGFFESASIIAAGSSANYFWITLGTVTAISKKRILPGFQE